MQGYFVSDLHLFSRRSHASRHQAAIAKAASKANMFVLGGDIFDFRWTTFDNTNHTIDAATDWLSQLISPHPDCEFHYVLGNHDFNHFFTRRLEELSETWSNFTWHPYFFRRGGKIFLHGDVADNKMGGKGGHAALVDARNRWMLDDRKRGRTANAVYDIVVGARIHRMVGAVANTPRRVAKKLHAYLLDIDHTAENGLRHVYFGHTHVPMADYQYRGLYFHNGGAPIKGLQFRIVPFQVTEEFTTDSLPESSTEVKGLESTA